MTGIAAGLALVPFADLVRSADISAPPGESGSELGRIGVCAVVGIFFVLVELAFGRGNLDRFKDLVLNVLIVSFGGSFGSMITLVLLLMAAGYMKVEYLIGDLLTAIVLGTIFFFITLSPIFILQATWWGIRAVKRNLSTEKLN